MLCGPLGDASRKCFPLPIYGTASDVVTFVDDVIQTTGVTIHDAANMLAADKHANMEGAVAGDFGAEQASVAIYDNFGLSSPSCLEVTPGGTATSARVYPAAAANVPVTVGDYYTSIIAVYELKSAARDFQAAIAWFDSGESFLSVSSGSSTAATYGEWTIFTVTAAAPTSAAYARPRIHEPSNATTDKFLVDCFALAPASYDRWNLPSASPGVIEFASARAVGERVTANASGTRVTRVRSSAPNHANEMHKPGHAVPSRMRLFEAVEF
jgi:hypothetical protein